MIPYFDKVFTIPGSLGAGGFLPFFPPPNKPPRNPSPPGGFGPSGAPRRAIPKAGMEGACLVEVVL